MNPHERRLVAKRLKSTSDGKDESDEEALTGSDAGEVTIQIRDS